MKTNFLEDMRKIIENHGHQVLGVGANPSFTYTIGLSEKHGFELIMVGLRSDYAGQILNSVAEYLKTGPIVTGKEYDDFATMPSVFQECDPVLVKEYTLQAEQYYGKPVKVVQLVMCDRDGIFPEEEGYDTEYMSPRQPLLYSLKSIAN